MGLKVSKRSNTYDAYNPPSYSSSIGNKQGLPPVYAKLAEKYILECAMKDSDAYPTLIFRTFMDHFSPWAIGRKLEIEEMHTFCFIAAYKLKEEKLGINDIDFEDCILNIKTL
tara:strand:- start:3371 stop:3709 length:339 start_codon:yes stop_codon:yes gene_type:complete